MNEDKKKTWLRKLRLAEVSLVDMGADTNAQVEVFKRGDAQLKGSEMNDMEKIAAQMQEAAKNIEGLQAQVTKAKEDIAAVEAERDVLKHKLAIAEATKDGDEDDILKAADPVVAAEIKKLRAANAASAKKLAEISEAEEVRKFIDRAKADYPNLPVKAEELGPVLKRATGTLPAEDMETLLRVLKAASAGMSDLLRASGLPATLVRKGTAEAEIERLAKEAQTRDGITFAKAYDKVLAENPGLYREFLGQRAEAMN